DPDQPRGREGQGERHGQRPPRQPGRLEGDRAPDRRLRFEQLGHVRHPLTSPREAIQRPTKLTANDTTNRTRPLKISVLIFEPDALPKLRAMFAAIVDGFWVPIRSIVMIPAPESTMATAMVSP